MPRVREGAMSATVEAAQMSPRRHRADPAQKVGSQEDDARGVANPQRQLVGLQWNQAVPSRSRGKDAGGLSRLRTPQH